MRIIKLSPTLDWILCFIAFGWAVYEPLNYLMSTQRIQLFYFLLGLWLAICDSIKPHINRQIKDGQNKTKRMLFVQVENARVLFLENLWTKWNSAEFSTHKILTVKFSIWTNIRRNKALAYRKKPEKNTFDKLWF